MSTSLSFTAFQKDITDGFESILDYVDKCADIVKLSQTEHVKYMLKYNVEGGKHLRSCIILSLAKNYSDVLNNKWEGKSNAIVAVTIEMVNIL